VKSSSIWKKHPPTKKPAREFSLRRACLQTL